MKFQKTEFIICMGSLQITLFDHVFSEMFSQIFLEFLLL
jgi:hypothetical protein